MCRAVWVVVLGSSDEDCKRLRRAAGVEAQVVGMSTDADEALAETANADAVLIDAAHPRAAEVAAAFRARGAGVVWVGEAAPPEAHAAVGADEDLGEVVPGAITRALIARRAKA